MSIIILEFENLGTVLIFEVISDKFILVEIFTAGNFGTGRKTARIWNIGYKWMR
jgi:hypothetical protein